VGGSKQEKVISLPNKNNLIRKIVGLPPQSKCPLHRVRDTYINIRPPLFGWQDEGGARGGRGRTLGHRRRFENGGVSDHSTPSGRAGTYGPASTKQKEKNPPDLKQ